MKIPTLLALSLIIIAVVLGVAVFLLYQNQQSKLKVFLAPKNIKVANLNSTSASLIWQTGQPTIGLVKYGTNPTLLTQTGQDERDKNSQQLHLTHFVSLKDLKPETTYYYQIKSSNFTYPEAHGQFKTTKSGEQTKNSTNNPLRGVILEGNNPIDEAIVLLESDQISPQATYTTTAGNFILPLSNLDLKEQTKAKILVERGNVNSEVTLLIPPKEQTPLPNIYLGQSVDLRAQQIAAETSLDPTLTLKEKVATSSSSIYDLNGDLRLNAVDLSIVLDSINTNQKNSKADFNKDGNVDQKDVDALKKALQ